MKTMIVSILLAVAALAVPGCVSSGSSGSMSEPAEIKEVKCSGKQNCDAKWDQALAWVQRNAGTQLRIANDHVIATDTPRNNAEPTVTVTKVLISGDAYRFDLDVNCANLFGCMVTWRRLTTSFNQELGAQ